MRTDSVVRNLMAQPVTDWPKHLRLAWEILANKRGVDDTTARAVVSASLSATHRCGQAIDQRSRANVSIDNRPANGGCTWQRAQTHCAASRGIKNAPFAALFLFATDFSVRRAVAYGALLHKLRPRGRNRFRMLLGHDGSPIALKPLSALRLQFLYKCIE